MDDHDHRHAEISEPEIPGYFDMLETALEELLLERRLILPGEIRRQIDVLDSRTPALGARVVARAWTDPEFRSRLLADGRGACEELGVTFYDDTGLVVLENTATVHNLVVCTLCSCYPRPVLGLPPDWYKLKPYRARAVVAPRALLAEFGTVIADNVEVRVTDFDISASLSRAAAAPRRNRRLHRGATGCPGDARRDDRRRAGKHRRKGERPMSSIEDFMHRLPNDVGGQPAASFERVEHELKPWKSAAMRSPMFSTSTKSSTPRRNGAASGAGYGNDQQARVLRRWLTAFSVILFQKGVLTRPSLPRRCRKSRAKIEAEVKQDNPGPGDGHRSQTKARSSTAGDANREGASRSGAVTTFPPIPRPLPRSALVNRMKVGSIAISAPSAQCGLHARHTPSELHFYPIGLWDRLKSFTRSSLAWAAVRCLKVPMSRGSRR